MMDIEKIALKCEAEKGEYEILGGTVYAYLFLLSELQAYTNEIIELCAQKAEATGGTRKFVASEIRNLKG